MKYLTVTIIILLLIINGLKAQHCTTFDELFRKRHKIAYMTYGHPYTTFDRHNKISFEQTILNIRDNIKRKHK